jgi:Protein of unknown function (DUF2934)
MDDNPEEAAQGRPKKRPAKRRTAKTAAEQGSPPAESNPRREMTGGMTADQKVDEASVESMVGSDPPGYLAVGVGAPDERQMTEPDEESIRRLAYEIWEREGRQPGRDEEYWLRARKQLLSQAAETARKRASR